MDATLRCRRCGKPRATANTTPGQAMHRACWTAHMREYRARNRERVRLMDTARKRRTRHP